MAGDTEEKSQWGQWRPYILEGQDSFIFLVDLRGAGLGHQDFGWPQAPHPWVKEGSTDSGKSASHPVLSLERPFARAPWCLSELCRSLEWGHPGSWIPLMKLSLHPWPFVLIETAQWPHASYVVGTAVVGRNARCCALWAVCPSPAVGMGFSGCSVLAQ